MGWGWGRFFAVRQREKERQIDREKGLVKEGLEIQ